jgi:hypothetical protein
MALRTVPNPVTAVNVAPFHSIWMRKAEGEGGRAREPHHVSRGFVYQRVYSWIGAREIIQP